MTFDYAKMRATAKRLIGKFGGVETAAQLLQPGEPVWNPTTQEYDVAVPVATSISALRIEVDDGMVQGTVIDEDMSVYVLDADVTPSKDDVFRVGGVDHSIVRIMEIKPSSVVLLYKVMVRR